MHRNEDSPKMWPHKTYNIPTIRTQTQAQTLRIKREIKFIYKSYKTDLVGITRRSEMKETSVGKADWITIWYQEICWYLEGSENIPFPENSCFDRLDKGLFNITAETEIPVYKLCAVIY